MNGPEKWFAVVTKPCLEQVATAGLIAKGFESFLPTCSSSREWSDRRKVIDVPLFAGYTFAKFPAQHRTPVLQTRGVWSIVSTSEGPVPLEESEVAALRALVKSGVPVAPWPYLCAGQWARVDRGPLAGLEGIVVQVKNRTRIVVSVTILQRSVFAEVDRDAIWPLGEAPAIGRLS